MKKLLQSPWLTALLFVLAAGLLLTGAIGGIRAALTRESAAYLASIGTQDIGVTLLENGEAVGWRDADGSGGWNERRGALLSGMLAENESVQPGKAYPESLCVKNSGKIESFVRVSLYCYWQDASGNKMQALSPEFIQLALLTGEGWVIDEQASTAERTVLYYTRALAAGETTPPCCESLTIDPAVRSTLASDGTSYNGMSFRVEAEVEAVQSHNAAAAIRSAWGRNVTVSGSVLTLN